MVNKIEYSFVSYDVYIDRTLSLFILINSKSHLILDLVFKRIKEERNERKLDIGKLLLISLFSLDFRY